MQMLEKSLPAPTLLQRTSPFSGFSGDSENPGTSSGFLIPSPFRWKRVGKTILAATALFLVFCAYLGSREDFTLTFDRQVHSRLNATALGPQLDELANWPRWMSSLVSAEAVDEKGQVLPEKKQTLHPGALIRLSIDPKKGLDPHFSMLARVEVYRPGRELRLRIVSESRGRLFHYFRQIEWQVAITPNQAPGQGSLIEASARAETSNWRTRLTGTLARKILMAQIYYPDVIKLADPAQAELSAAEFH